MSEYEKLDSKWIDEYAQGGCDEWVYTDDLQNLLVPKQEGITHKKVEKYLLDRNIRVIDIDIYEKMQSDLAEFENKIVIEKPVIPKFVAEYIDNRKEVGFPIYQAIRIVRENSRFEHSHLREWLWTNKGQETFIRAWLDGYEVEKEKLYTIEFPQAEGVFARYTGDEFREWEIMDELVIIGNSDWQYKFTEAEIKAIDERYLAFKVPVEED